MELDRLMKLPWTIRVELRDDDGDYYVARVAELPGLVATGDDEEALDVSFWEALEAHLQMRLDAGDEIPVPEGVPEATIPELLGVVEIVDPRRPQRTTASPPFEFGRGGLSPRPLAGAAAATG